MPKTEAEENEDGYDADAEKEFTFIAKNFVKELSNQHGKKDHVHRIHLLTSDDRIPEQKVTCKPRTTQKETFQDDSGSMCMREEKVMFHKDEMSDSWQNLEKMIQENEAVKITATVSHNELEGTDYYFINSGHFSTIKAEPVNKEVEYNKADHLF